MSNSDSDTDSSTSTESTLTINTSDYEDLTDLDSFYSSDSDSSSSSSSDSDSSCDSMKKYGFMNKLKENLFKCKNCFKIFKTQNDLNEHNNECIQFFEKNYEDVKNYINNQTFDEFVDNDTFGKLII